MNESIYSIGTSGDVRVLELPNGVYLGQFYCDSLKCENFDICAQHRLEHGDFDLLVIGDEEAQLSGGVHNAMLTDTLGFPFYGDGLLVCLHAVGEDGDDSRLADVERPTSPVPGVPLSTQSTVRGLLPLSVTALCGGNAHALPCRRPPTRSLR
jgi:hypothetical protein